MEPEVRTDVDANPSTVRRRDAETMIELIRRATGEAPHMWGPSSGSDLTTLQSIVAASYATLTAGTFTSRASQGGTPSR